MKLLATLSACAALVALGGVRASADTFTYDISGLNSEGGFLDNFPTLTHDFGVAGTVTLVSFDVNYESFDPSWQSEVQIAIDTDDDDGIDGDLDMLDFGAPDDPGTFTGTGSEGADTFTSNGRVYLTIYEIFDDASSNPDATFGAGSSVTVTFAPVPAPSSVAVLALGLMGLPTVSLLRRRKK